MRQVGTVTLSRGTAPAFLPLTEHEVTNLRHLPAWMRWLFLELVGIANFKTGKGCASWARLEELMDWDKPERGRRAAPELSDRQIRRAFDALASLNLVARDKARNEANGKLFFQVSPRVGFSASAGKTGRVSVMGAKPVSTSENTPVEPAIPAGYSAGGSRMNTTPYPRDAKFSTPVPSDATKPPAALVAEVRARRGIEQGPPGGQNVAPAGHTPRGLRPPASPLGDTSPAGSHQQRDEGPGGPMLGAADLLARALTLAEGRKAAFEMGEGRIPEADPNGRASPTRPEQATRPQKSPA